MNSEPFRIPAHLPIYVYDPTVDDALDEALRRLLSCCFSVPVLRRQRFNYELPAHRWILFETDGDPFAHVAVHDKHIGTPDGDVRVGGVAEVCVHPSRRGQGHVRTLLESAHAWMRQQGMAFSILFGRPEVYGGSGYRHQSNPLRYFRMDTREWVTEILPDFMVLQLGERAWPKGEIDLRSPTF